MMKSHSRKIGMNVPPFERFEQNYPTWGDYFAQDGDIGYFILRDYDSGKWFGSVENMTTGELIYETGMHVGFIATYEEMKEAMSRNRYVGKRKKRAYEGYVPSQDYVDAVFDYAVDKVTQEYAEYSRFYNPRSKYIDSHSFKSIRDDIFNALADEFSKKDEWWSWDWDFALSPAELDELAERVCENICNMPPDREFFAKRRKCGHELWAGLDGADEVKYNILMDYFFETESPAREEEWLWFLDCAVEDIANQLDVEISKSGYGFYSAYVDPDCFDIEEREDYYATPCRHASPNYSLDGSSFSEELCKVYNHYAEDIYLAWKKYTEAEYRDWELYGEWAELLKDAADAVADRADELAKEIHVDCYDWYLADDYVSYEWWDDEYYNDIVHADERYKPYLTARRKKALARELGYNGPSVY